MKLIGLLRKFLGDSSGATVVEYALIGGLISTVIVAALLGIAPTLNETFTSVGDGMRVN